jgi:hypothetical protein
MDSLLTPQGAGNLPLMRRLKYAFLRMVGDFRYGIVLNNSETGFLELEQL